MSGENKMDIEIIQNVVEEFTKRLQLPESRYDFVVTSNAETVELLINVDGAVGCSLSIGNGSIKVIYNNDYDSDEYIAIQFITPVSLIYYLSVFFYKTVLEVTTLTFNDLLSVVLLDDITDWKSLVFSLCENIGMMCDIQEGPDVEDCVIIEGMKLHFSGFINLITINDVEIKLEDHEYTTVVEAMFKCVEYVANILDVADNIFVIDEEPENVMEMEDEMGGPAGGPGGGDVDIDMDMEMGGEETGMGEEPEPVETVENEDFTEPQGAVITMDDLIE